MENAFLEEVIDWINKTDDLLSQCSQSQSQISHLPDNDVDVLINRFIGILQFKSCHENLSIVTKAVSNLLIFIENVSRKEDEIIFLIQQLINSLIKCYEVTHQKESDGLLQDINEIILVCTNEKNMKNQLLNGLMGNILSIVTSTSMHIWIRRNFLKLLTGLLIGSDRRERHKLWVKYYENVNQLADYIFTCGDYDIQTYLVEILYRFSSKTDRTEIATVWFPNNAVVQSSFANIKDFECDCRIFLNNFNTALGENQMVYSLAAQSCQIGNTQVFKPPDPKYSQFWIDFNLGTGNLIIYCVKTPQSKEMWDTIILNSGEVTAVKMDIFPSGETTLNLNLVNHVSELFTSSPTSSTFLGKSVDIIFRTQPMIDYLPRILKIMYSEKFELKSRVRCSVASMPHKIRNNKHSSSNKIIPSSNGTSSSKKSEGKFTTPSSNFGDTKTTGDNQVTNISKDREKNASHSNRIKMSKSDDLKISNDMPGNLISKTSQISIKTNKPRDLNVGSGIVHDADKVICNPRINAKIIKASKSGVSKISSDIVFDHSLDPASSNKSSNSLNSNADARKMCDIDQDHNADIIAVNQGEKQQKFQKSTKPGDIKTSSHVVHNSRPTQYHAPINSTLAKKNEVQEDAVNVKKRSKVSCPIDKHVSATNKTSSLSSKGSSNLLISASNSKQNQIMSTQNSLREITNLDHSKTYKNDAFKASISSKSKITPGIYQLNSKRETNLHEKENQTKTGSQKQFQSKVSLKQTSTNKIKSVMANSSYDNDSLNTKENKISYSNAKYPKVSIAQEHKHIIRHQNSHKKSRSNVSLIDAENISKLKTKYDVNENDKQCKSDNSVLSQNKNPEITENSKNDEIVIDNTVKTNEKLTHVGMVSKLDNCTLSQNEDDAVNTSEIEHKSPQSVDVNLIKTRNSAPQMRIEKEPNYATSIEDSLPQKVKTENATEIKTSPQSINIFKTDVNENQMDVINGLNSSPGLESKEHLNFDSVTKLVQNENSQLKSNEIPKKNKLRKSKVKKKRSANHNSSAETSKSVSISDNRQSVKNDNASGEIESNNVNLDRKDKEKRLENEATVVKCDSVTIKEQKNEQASNDVCQVVDITEVFFKEAIEIPPSNENSMNKSVVSASTINTKPNNNSKLTLSRGRNRAIRKLSRVNHLPKDLKSKKCLSFLESPIKQSLAKGLINNGDDQAKNISDDCQIVHDPLPKVTCSVDESISESSNFLDLGLKRVQNNEQSKNITEDLKESVSISVDMDIGNNFINSPQQEINAIKIPEQNAKMTMSGGRKRATRSSSRVEKKLAGSEFVLKKALTYTESDLNLDEEHSKDNNTKKEENLYCEQPVNNVDLDNTVTVNPNDNSYEKCNKANCNVLSTESKSSKQNVDCQRKKCESKLQPDTADNKCVNLAISAKSNKAASKNIFNSSNLDKKNTTHNSASYCPQSNVLKENTNNDYEGMETFDKGNMLEQKLGNQISITGVTPLIKYIEKSSKDENDSPLEVDHLKSLQNCSLNANSVSKSSEERNSSRKKKLHSIRPNVLEEINCTNENLTTVLKTPTFEDVYGSRQKKEDTESSKQNGRRKVCPLNKKDVKNASKNKRVLKEDKGEPLPPLIVKRKENTFLSSTVVSLGFNSNAPSVLDASEILPTKKRKFFQNERKDYDSKRWECFAGSDFKLRQRKRINYDESLFDSVGSPAGDSVATCSKYSKKRQRENVEIERSSKYDNIDDDTPLGKKIRFSDWRDKCSQKRMKVKKYGPAKTKTINFSRNDQSKLRKDENTDYAETKAYSDQYDEDIERNHYSPVGVDALSRPKRNDVKGSNSDQILVAFDDTMIRLSNQIQQITDLPKDEKALYCPKAKKIAELSNMLIFNLLF